MSIVKINKFSGGLAEDVREKRSDSFANAHNFDVFNNDFLKPYRDTETATLSSGTIDAFKITDAVVNTSSNATSQKNIFFLGRAGSAVVCAVVASSTIPATVSLAFTVAVSASQLGTVPFIFKI